MVYTTLIAYHMELKSFSAQKSKESSATAHQHGHVQLCFISKRVPHVNLQKCPQSTQLTKHRQILKSYKQKLEPKILSPNAPHQLLDKFLGLILEK